MVRATDVRVCPVSALQEFLKVRPLGPGPLFYHFSGEPLTCYQFNAVLRNALVFCSLGEQHIRAHLFRIGVATVAHELGVPLAYNFNMSDQMFCFGNH